MLTFEQTVLRAEQQLLSADLFYGHGLHNAYDEAVYAAQFCAHLSVMDEPDWDAPYPEDAQVRLDALIAERCVSKKPLAYLTHEAYLYGYKFYVDERVIVPRSFLAELILDQFAPWIVPDEVTDVLELCTGSGCLAIMAADAFAEAQVDAVDISVDALAVAQRNVADYGLNERVHLIESDLYQAIPAGKQYDLIFSNPPYVNSISMACLPDEYRAEPNIALAGGDDGMDLVRIIVRDAGRYLKPNGILVVEIGNEYGFAVQAFKDLPLTWLDVSGSDDGVFLLTAADLQKAMQSI
ncbi:MAG: 50S ribosomal protein L3 N(5)-glutamine methyltransferase [Burkholderiales bacterium]|nr:50S ribosomal protein L3 N(5)-glutamine methyltransferase [Burkholderiales bacterium]